MALVVHNALGHKRALGHYEQLRAIKAAITKIAMYCPISMVMIV